MAIQTLKPPICSPVYASVDGVELKDSALLHTNCFLTGTGSLAKRPAFRKITATDWGSGWYAKGAYFSGPHNAFYCILVDSSGASNYSIGKLVGTTKSISATGIAALTTEHPIITDAIVSGGSDYVFFACGGYIAYMPSTFTGLNTVAAPAPASAVSLAALDNYLIANTKNGNSFQWSNLLDALTWVSGSTAQPVAKPDACTSVIVVGQRLYIIGWESVEVWENDGVSPLSRIQNGVFPFGNPGYQHCIAVDDDTIYMYAGDRHLYKIQGASYERVATPYDNILKNVGADAFLNVQTWGDSRVLILRSGLTAGVNNGYTCVYNLTTGDWSELTHKMSAGTYEYIPIFKSAYSFYEKDIFHCFNAARNYPCTTSLTNYTDDFSYADGEQNYPVEITTGHIDYGTTKRKRSHEFRLKLKKGATATAKTAYITFLDDNEQTWGPFAIDLSTTGDTDIPFRIPRCGIFRTRQYKIAFEGDAPFTIVDAEEDIEVLR